MIYSDLNLHVNEMTTDPIVIDQFSINQSIIAIIGTIPGQRLFRPDFGCNVHNQLFESMNSTTASAIRNGIMLAIERWETRITLTQSVVVPDYTLQIYHVHLDYVIPTLQNQAASFAFDLNKLN